MNPHDLWSADFESAASAIPPQPRSEVIILKCLFFVNFKGCESDIIFEDKEQERAMQVHFEKVDSKEQEEAVIKAVEITDEISGAIELLEGDAKGFAVSKDGKTYIIKASNVYYIESVDKKTFVYTKQGCYDTKYRLYELEVMLGGYFMRCSKSMIINLKKVRNVKSQISGRIDATLLNDEVVVISRGYVKEVKRRLGIG